MEHWMIDPHSIKIYHITHLKNLPSIIKAGLLWSDTKRCELGLECEIVGMSEIKRRRLEELSVTCHPGTMVGDYVPFYFCPRSIMLYILHMGNHPDLNYHEGQSTIVHLQADITTTIQWAEENNIRWAFSTSNAGAKYTQYYKNTESLNLVNWDAVQATNFRDPFTKEGKQAEFLVYESIPLEMIEKIGVIDSKIEHKVNSVLEGMQNKPLVTIERNWYY